MQASSSRKVESLPADLKKVAEELINKKEGVHIPSPAQFFVPPTPPPPPPMWWNEPLAPYEMDRIVSKIVNGQANFQRRFYDARKYMHLGLDSHEEIFLTLQFASYDNSAYADFTVYSEKAMTPEWYAKEFYRLLKTTGKQWRLV